MAISTAAALIGSAVIGAGASAYASSKAAKSAKSAATQAADANAAVNREIYQQTRQDLSPYNQAGQASLGALMQRLGLAPMTAPGVQPQTAPAGAQVGGSRPSAIPTQGFGGYGATDAALGGPAAKAASAVANAAGGAPQGGVDYARLFAERPDVKAEYDKLSASADRNSPWFAQHGLDRGAEGFADWWLANKPAEDTYQAPQVGQQAPAPTAPADPNAPPAQYHQETYADRPADTPAPTFTRPQDPANAPDLNSFFSKFEEDPGAAYRRDQALRGVNANFAARGKLRSGDAAAALAERAGEIGSQEYGNWFARQMQKYQQTRAAFDIDRDRGDRNFVDDRSYGTNLWNTQQQRRDNIYSEDRGFSANRNDNQTANLFNLVGVGQGAAAGTAAAGQNYAAGVTNSNNARAAATGNAAIANAANMTNLFGSAANAVGTYYGLKGRI